MRYILDQLELEAENSRAEWKPVLRYVAELHGRSIHAPEYPFELPWEEIGPGYANAPAFGHWDIAHAVLDSVLSEPGHARSQIRNQLKLQLNSGLIGGAVWMRRNAPGINLYGFAPVWIHAVEELCRVHGDWRFAAECLEPLRRQIGWFERERRASDGGFRYTDLAAPTFESGLDEGARFLGGHPADLSFIDASCHVLWMYDTAAAWAERFGLPADAERRKAAELRTFIRERLFNAETGFFHDAWHVGNPAAGGWGFDGIWALVSGAATAGQADRAIDENLLNPDRFFTPHPVPTVCAGDPLFELRMWRGPAWNSMTYFAAWGCFRYGRRDAAAKLLERALDSTQKQFARTGRIWEFYHPFGGEPETLLRKPETAPGMGPNPDYLGHNPLLAMARLWRECVSDA